MNPKPKPTPKPLNISIEINQQAVVTSKKILKATLGQNVEPTRKKSVTDKTSAKEVTKKASQERRANKLRREQIEETSEETSWSSDSDLDEDPHRK
ncbi:hypothetical protein CPB97_002572 [Podila verticillata]|nr:hypothetical protein CPB97_002572 [Podila verticillata]